jgi:hypothetical protein
MVLQTKLFVLLGLLVEIGVQWVHVDVVCVTDLDLWYPATLSARYLRDAGNNRPTMRGT